MTYNSNIKTEAGYKARSCVKNIINMYKVWFLLNKHSFFNAIIKPNHYKSGAFYMCRAYAPIAISM